MKYLAFDTETGGLNPKEASLLTAYFAVLDENFNAVAELDLRIKNDKNEVYKVTGEALKINGIDLVEHHSSNRNSTKGIAALQLKDLLHANFKDEALIPIGHNVDFDIGFVQEHLIPRELWNQYVSYRKLDTAVIANFLKAKKKIPDNTSTSLGGLAKFFKIDIGTGSLHNAKIDTVVTVALLQEMLKV